MVGHPEQQPTQKEDLKGTERGQSPTKGIEGGQILSREDQNIYEKAKLVGQPKSALQLDYSPKDQLASRLNERNSNEMISAWQDTDNPRQAHSDKQVRDTAVKLLASAKKPENSKNGKLDKKVLDEFSKAIEDSKDPRGLVQEFNRIAAKDHMQARYSNDLVIASAKDGTRETRVYHNPLGKDGVTPGPATDDRIGQALNMIKQCPLTDIEEMRTSSSSDPQLYDKLNSAEKDRIRVFKDGVQAVRQMFANEKDPKALTQKIGSQLDPNHQQIKYQHKLNVDVFSSNETYQTHAIDLSEKGKPVITVPQSPNQTMSSLPASHTRHKYANEPFKSPRADGPSTMKKDRK